jgi:hypothetical protein
MQHINDNVRRITMMKRAIGRQKTACMVMGLTACGSSGRVSTGGIKYDKCMGVILKNEKKI